MGTHVTFKVVPVTGQGQIKLSRLQHNLSLSSTPAVIRSLISSLHTSEMIFILRRLSGGFVSSRTCDQIRIRIDKSLEPGSFLLKRIFVKDDIRASVKYAFTSLGSTPPIVSRSDMLSKVELLAVQGRRF